MLFRRGWQACRRRYETLIEFPFDIRATYFELHVGKEMAARLEDYKRRSALRYPTNLFDFTEN